MSFKSEFQSRERESSFNTAGGSEFQVRGAAVLSDRLANDVRRNGSTAVGRMSIKCYARILSFHKTGVDLSNFANFSS